MIPRRVILLVAFAATACLFAHSATAQDASSSQSAPAIARGFLTVGDWGCSRINKYQKAVAEQMGLWADKIQAAFVVSVGDNFYERGVHTADDPLFQSVFEDVYSTQSLQKPWFVVLGNHDHLRSADAQIEYSKKSARWKLPNLYYKQQFQVPGGKSMDFIFIDTILWIDGDSAQREWFEAQLADSKAEWLMVAGHYPVYSAGEHGSSRRLIDELRPLLEKYQVTAYFAGHDHSLQHSVNNGVHYIVSGAGCKRGRQRRELSYKVYGEPRNGFTVHSFDDAGSVQTVQFVDYTGHVRHQYSLMPRNATASK